MVKGQIVCRRCKTERFHTDYTKKMLAAAPNHAVCKICMAEIRKIQYNKDIVWSRKNGLRKSKARYHKLGFEINQLNRVQSWAQGLLNNARSASKIRAYPAPSITKDWILNQFRVQNERCYWTGVKLDPSLACRSLFQPSLDRIDSSMYYTPDNVVIACWAANAAKGNQSPGEFKTWIAEIRRGAV